MNSGLGGVAETNNLNVETPTSFDDLIQDDLDQQQEEQEQSLQREPRVDKHRNRTVDRQYIDSSPIISFDEFQYTYDNNDDVEENEIKFVSISNPDDDDQEHDASLSSGLTNVSHSPSYHNQVLEYPRFLVPSIQPLSSRRYDLPTSDDLHEKSSNSDFSSDQISVESVAMTLTPPRRPTAASPSNQISLSRQSQFSPEVPNSKISSESKVMSRTPPRHPNSPSTSPPEVTPPHQSENSNSKVGFETPMKVNANQPTPKIVNKRKRAPRTNFTDTSSDSSGSMSGSGINELVHQVKSIDDLLAREIMFTPPRYMNPTTANRKMLNSEEDDGMATELESLARSELLLRQELDIFASSSNEDAERISSLDDIFSDGNDNDSDSDDTSQTNSDDQIIMQPSIAGAILSPFASDGQRQNPQVIQATLGSDVDIVSVEDWPTHHGEQSVPDGKVELIQPLESIENLGSLIEKPFPRGKEVAIEVKFEDTVHQSHESEPYFILSNFPPDVEQKLSPASTEREDLIPITSNSTETSESLLLYTDSDFLISSTQSSVNERALSETIASDSKGLLLHRPDKISARRQTDGDEKPEILSQKPDWGIVSNLGQHIAPDSTLVLHEPSRSMPTDIEVVAKRPNIPQEPSINTEAEESIDTSRSNNVINSPPLLLHNRSRSFSDPGLSTFGYTIHRKESETLSILDDLQSLEASSDYGLDRYLVSNVKSPSSIIRCNRSVFNKSLSLSEIDERGMYGTTFPTEILQGPFVQPSEKNRSRSNLYDDIEEASFSPVHDRQCQDSSRQSESSYQSLEGERYALSDILLSPDILLKHRILASDEIQGSHESSKNIYHSLNDSNVISQSTTTSSQSVESMSNNQGDLQASKTIRVRTSSRRNQSFGLSDTKSFTDNPAIKKTETTPLSLIASQTMFFGNDESPRNFEISPISLDKNESVDLEMPPDVGLQQRILFKDEFDDNVNGDSLKVLTSAVHVGDYHTSPNNVIPTDINSIAPTSTIGSPFFSLSISDEMQDMWGFVDNEEEIVFDNAQSELFDTRIKTTPDNNRIHLIAPDSSTGASRFFLESNSDEVHELDSVDTDEKEVQSAVVSPNYYQSDGADAVHIPSFYQSPLTETNLLWHLEHAQRQPTSEDTHSKNSYSDTPSMTNVKVLSYSNESLTASIATNEVRPKELNGDRSNNKSSFLLPTYRHRVADGGRKVWTAYGGLVICFLLFTLIIGIILIVVLMQQPKRGNDDNLAIVATLTPTSGPTPHHFNQSFRPTVGGLNTSSPTSVSSSTPSFVSPSNSPTFFLKDDDLYTLLISISPDDGKALRSLNESVPQYQAFDWLSRNSFLSSYSQEQIIQRYAMATFYFSTNGDNWERNDLWLSNSDECYWYSKSIEQEPCGPYNTTNLTLVMLDLRYSNETYFLKKNSYDFLLMYVGLGSSNLTQNSLRCY